MVMPFDSTGTVKVGVVDAWAPVTRTAPPIKIDSLLAMPLKKSFLSFILRSSESVGLTVEQVYGAILVLQQNNSNARPKVDFRTLPSPFWDNPPSAGLLQTKEIYRMSLIIDIMR
jgi:hypothetical protein